MKIIEALALATPYIHLALKQEAIVAVVEKESETVVKYLAGKRVDSGYHDGQKLMPMTRMFSSPLMAKMQMW